MTILSPSPIDPTSILTSTLTSAIGGGSKTVPGIAQGGDISDRSAINIAPVGVNLGAILAPFNQGAPENGGYGLEVLSRYADNQAPKEISTLVAKTSDKIGWFLPVAIIAGLGAIYLVMR